MKQRAQSQNTTVQASRWARRLSRRVQKVLKAHPEADPDNVRPTLMLLELPPLERLRRGLIRGRRTKKIPGEGFKRASSPLIKMDEAVKAKVNKIFGNSGNKS
jgi:hypothetical protein